MPTLEYSSGKVDPAFTQTQLDILQTHAGRAGERLLSQADNTLASYLTALSSPGPMLSVLSEKARLHLTNAVAKARIGFHRPDGLTGGQALEALWRRPVVFTGPHLQLLPERFTIAGYLTALAHALANDEPAAWVYPCSTLRLQVEHRRGPGWLAYRDRQINIFGLSTQQMKRRRVCVPAEPLKMTFGGETEDIPENLAQIARHADGSSAADQFHTANGAFLARNIERADPGLVVCDERFVGCLVAEHLADESSPLAKLLLDDALALRWRMLVERQSKRVDARAFRHPTEHLWLCQPQGRLRALRRVNGNFVCASDATPAFRADAQSLSAALAEGRAVPSLFLAYYAIGFLPRIRLVGGVRQLFYHKAYYDLWKALLNPAVRDEAAFLRALPSESDDAWGLTALEASPGMIDEMIDGTGFGVSAFVRNSLSRTLRRTSNNFEAVRKHEYLAQTGLKTETIQGAGRLNAGDAAAF